MTPEQVAKNGTEHSIQTALFCWSHTPEVKEKYPLLDSLLLFAIPNGGARGDSSRSNAIRGGKLKAEGVKAGVPDIFLSLARGQWFGLYIEMKKPQTGKITDKQLEFKSLVESEGYLWLCYNNWEQARDALIYYYTLPKIKVA